MTTVKIDITEQYDRVLPSFLKQELQYEETPERVREAMNVVAAWYSVPGEYEGGKYDVRVG